MGMVGWDGSETGFVSWEEGGKTLRMMMLTCCDDGRSGVEGSREFAFLAFVFSLS